MMEFWTGGVNQVENLSEASTLPAKSLQISTRPVMKGFHLQCNKRFDVGYFRLHAHDVDDKILAQNLCYLHMMEQQQYAL